MLHTINISGKFISTIICLFTVCFVCGCSSFNNYRSLSSSFYDQYRLGDVGSAALAVTDVAAKRAESSDALLWRLEEGSLLRANNKFQDSNTAFSQAEEIIERYDSRASISARSTGSQFASLLTNLNAIPYKGYAYDRIMLNTYKALNYIALGQLNDARVEVFRAYERQKEALDRYRRELERVEKEAESRSIDIGEITGNPRVQDQLDRHYGKYNKLAAYADYVNPLTVYLDGLLFFASATDGADYDRARLNFERIRAMIGSNAFIEADLSAINYVGDGTLIEPTVYVIFENGLAPVRSEERFDIPLPYQEISYIGAAIPVLNFQATPLKSLGVFSEERNITQTKLLSDMDGIIANEFSNGLQSVILHTAMAAALKATAQYQLEKNFGSLGRIGGALYSMTTTQADLRSWISLPKQFQFARFPRPSSPAVYLRTADRTINTKVDLPESDIILIYAKAINGRELSYVHTIKLR